MAIGDIIVGVDLGTSKVSAIVGEVNNFNQIEVVCSASYKCSGIKKTKIINEEEVTNSITKVIEKIEEESESKINSVSVNVPGKYITIAQNSITREARDRYSGISFRDVQLAIMQARDIEIPDSQFPIDILPTKFILDNGKNVEDPIGEISTSFTLEAKVILIDKEYKKQLTNIFKKAGLEIDNFVPTALAEKNVILDANEQHDNVLTIDIGAGNTEIGVFEGNKFVYTTTIPVGGNSITNDIALVLNISEEEAEKLKKQYGLALKSFIDNDNDILLNTFKGDSKNKTIKSSELIEIIEARIEEIFSIINKEITAQGVKPKINTAILVGQGITNINKCDVAGKINLNIPVKLATGRAMNTVRPNYREVYALVRYIAAKPFVKSVSSRIDTKSEEGFFKNLMERIKEFFYS